jgi:hypothetical protein
VKYLLGLFFIVHGLIHLSFVSPQPPVTPGAPTWPFSITHSWLGLPANILKSLGITLAIISAIGFFLVGLSYLGIIVPTEWFRALALVSAVCSFILIATFWNNWFVVGILIDVVIIAWLAFLK